MNSRSSSDYGEKETRIKNRYGFPKFVISIDLGEVKVKIPCDEVHFVFLGDCLDYKLKLFQKRRKVILGPLYN